MALALALPVSLLLHTLLVLWIGAAMLEAIRTVALRVGANGTREILLLPDGGLEVRDSSRRLRRGHLADGSFVAPWLTIIRWRPERSLADRSVVILPDMLDADGFRALRVELRWRGRAQL